MHMYLLSTCSVPASCNQTKEKMRQAWLGWRRGHCRYRDQGSPSPISGKRDKCRVLNTRTLLAWKEQEPMGPEPASDEEAGTRQDWRGRPDRRLLGTRVKSLGFKCLRSPWRVLSLGAIGFDSCFRTMVLAAVRRTDC